MPELTYADGDDGVDPSSPPGLSSGFESGGALDTACPDAFLAALADAATGAGHLAGLDDDELIGVLRAWRRLESWCASGLLTVIAELARRRPADGTPAARPGAFPVQLSEFIADELAAALTLTARTADADLSLALDLAIRLPGTARGLRAGVIDRSRARLIADATRILTDDQARQVEDGILAAAGSQTTGQLRAALARAVLAGDPDAAARRREEAQRDPRVRRWQEDAGTAALAGFGLPPADVLAADQRLTTRALALREAGLPGSLEELRARAYLDTLLGQDSAPAAGRAQPASHHDPAGHHQPASHSSWPTGPGQEPTGRYEQADPPLTRSPAGAPSASAGSGTVARQPLTARVTLTVPLATYLGFGSGPGVVAGFGPVDAALARDLGTRAAAHPASRFCLTVTGSSGQAIGHGCFPGRPPDRTQLRPDSSAVTVAPLAGHPCDHRHQEPGYQPSRRLRHLVEARTPTCTAPGCSRSAARCDLDHTRPYQQGGRTCECNVAPLCRHHHRCKQSQGWRLDQPSPGVLHWTTPAGRRYTTQPASVSG